MANELRTFRCVTADGPEDVKIIDVLVWEDTVYLLCQGAREEPYVFQIVINGIRAAHPEIGRKLVALHKTEVEQWQATNS